MRSIGLDVTLNQKNVANLSNMFPNTLSDSQQQILRSKRRKTTRVPGEQKILRSIDHKSIIISGLLLLLLLLSITSMSTYYQVMGAVRCPKIKKHAGLKLKLEKKEPYVPRDVLIYSCESAGHVQTQTIKCLDDGHWSELPHCPDPSNYTCPDLPSLKYGMSNSTGPFKVGTVVAFKCDTETFPNVPNLPSTFATTQAPATTTTTTATGSLLGLRTNTSEVNMTLLNEPQPLRYNLSGFRLLKCLPSKEWNHKVPKCEPVYPEPPSQMGLFLTSTILILVPILILVVIAQLVIRWRKRQQQRERWKQYFTDYKYRHSKTSITFGMRPNPNTTSIPVTDL